MSSVRVRIAPSPTGAPHVGTAYIALFNMAFARRHGGELVLRIEDTDRSRSSGEHERRLMEALRWAGIEWQEGPDVGGRHGPYRQSERIEVYSGYAKQLVDQGRAYYSFTTPEELAAWRKRKDSGEPAPYEAEREQSTAAARKRIDAGTPHVIRMKTPREGSVTVADTLRGKIPFDLAGLDDQVLLKSDGFPTYHLAVVVDDHLMEISHVIRGEEWIPSAPKHLLLYDWLGWDPPEHTHLPLLLNPDRSKMSKRRNPTSIDFYRRAGYLPEALLNYLALMAYPPGEGGEEKFSLSELVGRLDLGRINLGGSVFDLEKLSWLNGRCIREDLTTGELLDRLKEWALNDGFIGEMIPLMQPRMQTLGDFMPACSFFFAREVEPAAEDLVPKKREPAAAAQMLLTAVWALQEVSPWNVSGVEAAVHAGELVLGVAGARGDPADVCGAHGTAGRPPAVRVDRPARHRPDAGAGAGRGGDARGSLQEEGAGPGERMVFPGRDTIVRGGPHSLDTGHPEVIPRWSDRLSGCWPPR